MEEANNSSERAACASVISSAVTTTSKVTSDSGYGSTSNKSGSGSGTQRSSGSSKSHQSSGSSNGFPGQQNASTANESGVTVVPGGPLSGGSKSKLDSKNRKKKSTRNRTSSLGESSSLQKANSLEPLEAGSPLPPPTSVVTDRDRCGTPAGGITSSGPLHSIGTADSPSSLGGGRCSPTDSKTLQMAALSHALSCMKKFRDNTLAEMAEEAEEENADMSMFWRDQFEEMKAELNFSSEEHSFGAVVSMEDGLVAHISEEIHSILGYPKDMWVGRSFMDLVHPRDKMAFASQCTCTSGLVLSQGTAVNSESFFCRLRQYRGLKTSGFGVIDKPLVFFPFQLTLKFKEIEGVPKTAPSVKKAKVTDGEEILDIRKPVYLFIGATRVSSAYKYPEELMNNANKFTTRHTANCVFGHMDPSAVNYLGHLPQDLIGHSVFDYYHPDDMGLMQGVYEGILAERGRPFKSKPYRFKVYNGTFAMLETDWSCFINPWSWKLEFVIGQHKVLKGPLNPNVFMCPKPLDEEDPTLKIKQAKEQIKQILGETVLHRDPGKQRAIKRKKDLVNLLESLLDQIGNPESSDLSDSVNSGAFSGLDRDSVMLGGISPHHDNHSSSNQSSETPPSYNQLNYRENIERFFQSHPKTTRNSDESGESPAKDMDLPLSTDDDSKGSPQESSESVPLHSGSGNSNEDSRSGQAAMDDGSQLLTEDILYKHNEHMEKCMVQKHKETRGNKNSMSSGRQRHIEQGDRGNHLKRSGIIAGCASSGSSRKAHKQPHLDQTQQQPSGPQYTGNPSEVQSVLQQQPHIPGMAPVNLWPPYSVANLRSAAKPVTTNVGMPMAAAAGLQIPNVQYVPSVAAASTSIGLSNPQNVINGNFCFQPHYTPHRGVSFPVTASVPNLMYNPLGIMGTTPTFAPSGAMFPATPQLPQPPLLGVGLPYPATGPLVPPSGVPGFNLRPNIPQIPLGGAGIPVTGQTVTTTSTAPVSSTYPSTAPHQYLRGRPQVQVTTSTSSSSSMLTLDSAPRPSEPVFKSHHRLQRKDSFTQHQKSAVPKKAAADFSSSDGFGDTSSGSFSFIKGGKSSDSFSNSPATDSKEENGGRWEKDEDEDCQNWADDGNGNNDVNGNGSRRIDGRRRLPSKPSWLQDINMTPELSMKYEMTPGDITDILKKDLDRLQLFGKQPTVNEQLEKLCSELGLDDNSTPNLHLEEGSSKYNSSYGSSNDDDDDNSCSSSKRVPLPSSSVDPNAKKMHKDLLEHRKQLSPWAYDRMVQIHEENAPFPKSDRALNILGVVPKLESSAE